MAVRRALFTLFVSALVVAPSAQAYGWPVAPFAKQHPIRGFFGDPRMRSPEPYDPERIPTDGIFTFHNGVDIAADGGTLVYPVASGVVRAVNGWKVVVRASRGRVFQYVHITPAVRVGDRVAVRRTVLGSVQPQAAHVHLTEVDGGRVVNPLQPGHLEPYRDATEPQVKGLVVRDADGRRLSASAVGGRVALEVDALDVPPLPVPGLWNGLPVTPALITWSVSNSSGDLVIAPATAVDFRRTVPSNRSFWRIYGPGTFENRPRYGGGRYVFRLSHAPLDTRSWPNGDYVVRVVVSDIRGNRTTAAAGLRVWNPSRT